MITALTGTPLDQVVEHAESAREALVGAGLVALLVAFVLAFLDDHDRGTVRSSLESATAAFRNAAQRPDNGSDGPAMAGAVEFVRAVAGPTETLFRRSRAVVALVIGGVLLIASALVPLFETALVANHCAGKVANAEATPEPSPSDAETSTPDTGDQDPGGAPAGDEEADQTPKEDKVGNGGGKGSDRGETSAAVAEPSVPKVFYPPACRDPERDSLG